MSDRDDPAPTDPESHRLLPLLAALAGCRVGSFWLEPSGSLDADATLLSIWGLRRELLTGSLGTALLSHVHPDDVAIAAELRAFHAQLARPARDELVFRIVRPDASVRWLLCREHTAEHPAQPGERVFGLVIDITSLKANEAACALQQNRTSVAALTAVLAHDFNNLLFAIMGNAGLALGSIEQFEDHPLRESLLEIERASQRASELVQRLSLFSRPQQARRQPLSLVRVVESVAHTARAALPPQVDLRMRFAAELPNVLADSKLAEHVVSNLLANASQAMESRPGAIELGLREVVLDATDPTLAPPVRSGRYVELAISDAGVGMNAVTRARIFEPFFTTRPPGKAMGIGLCIVEASVRAVDGALRVESSPDVGTRVTVYFPCA